MDCLRTGDQDFRMILCSNPKEQYVAYSDEINKAIQKVLDSGWYVNGKEVENFESEFCDFIGCKKGIGVASGTDALQISLEALNIGKGDEVITVSHGGIWASTVTATVGATPVFVDIKDDNFTINEALIEEKISSKTKAIIAVHIYGQPVEMDAIMKISKQYNIKVIEDCAQSHGAKYRGKRVGSLGDVSCFSFYPTKNLGAIGDGGMILTNSDEVAEKATLLKEYGWKRKFDSEFVGRNSRLDELQAAILRVKLRYMDQDNEKRRKLANRYVNNLKDTNLILPKVTEETEHVFHLFVIRSKNRDNLMKKLKDAGVHTMVHYPYPVHKQKAFKKYSNEKLAITESITETILSLPIYPELSFEEVDKISAVIQKHS